MENKNLEVEVMETENVEETTEKVGFLTKVKGFAKKHKKGLIAGAVTLGVIGLAKAALGRPSEEEYEDGGLDVETETLDFGNSDVTNF